MEDNEKALIRMDPPGAAANRALLASLARRTSYSISEVRDVIMTYHHLRDRIDALAAWRDSGRPLPDLEDEDEKDEIIKTIKTEREQGGCREFVWQAGPARRPSTGNSRAGCRGAWLRGGA
jgi:hypothetical protein